MAADVGQISFPTGTTGNLDFSLAFTPTKSDLIFKGSGILPAEGHQRGTDAWGFQNTSSVPVNKFFRVNTSAGSLLLEGTWVSYPTNKLRVNITTNNLVSSLPALLIYEN